MHASRGFALLCLVSFAILSQSNVVESSAWGRSKRQASLEEKYPFLEKADPCVSLLIYKLTFQWL